MIEGFVGFLKDIYKNKVILYELAKRDFQQQYMGSYLGFLWVYIQPLLFVSVIYLIFSFGVKDVSNAQNIPFVIHLISGIVAWFYVAGNLNANTQVIKKYAFLVKKVDFRLSMLPMVNLASSVVPHMFLIIITLILVYMNGMSHSFYIFQLIYYFFAMFFLLLGIGWLTSASQLFIPDVSKFINLIITFGFWLTPIFWDISRIPEKYQWLVSLNPFAYIVEGYRDSLYLQIAFWEKPYETLYFWTLTLMFLMIGISVFKKLRPHFAEVV